ncbi:MAG: tail fiber domain-containing protein [Acidobacteriota bacterium]
MRRVVYELALLSAIALLSATTNPLLADDAPVRLSYGSQQISWQLQTSAQRTVLTVSTPGGKFIRHEFNGADPAFDIAEVGAQDGVYRWELVSMLSANPRVRLEANAGGESTTRQRSAGTIQSGVFSVRDGALVSPELLEPSHGQSRSAVVPGGLQPLDVVTPDDAIIQGSLCVGLDCVNNESFGFDTIRLKENNTRIKFQDTSVGSFPATNWQLTANDSASGGANKFSIEDITGSKVPVTITAGAPTNSLFVDSSGRLGLGTSVPVLPLHLSSSNTPAIRLEQNNSGGFTAQTWDVAGNEANFFVRDVTGGSRLPFRIRPGAPTSSIDINASGNVGIGTASPANSLHVLRSDGTAKLFIQESNGTTLDREIAEFRNNGGSNLILKDSSRGERWAFGLFNGNFILNEQVHGGVELTLSSSGNLTIAGTLTQGSSRDIKQDISPVDQAGILDRLASLPVSTWRYRTDETGALHLGPMAQDFHAAFGLGEDDTHIAPGDVAGVSLAAIQALQSSLSDKDTAIRRLGQENADLAKRLAALEAAVEALTTPK